MSAAAFPWTFVPAPAPGARRADYFSWPDKPFTGLRWPFFALRGTRPGPAVAIVAAIHGGEYPGPVGALALGRALDPAELRGSLLILPIVNLPSFWARSAFVTPTDGKNLNRLFPGDPRGTFGDALAHRLLEDVLRPADAVIDLHSGDIFEALANHAGRHLSGRADVDATTRRMLAAFGLPYANEYPFPTDPRSLTATVAALGKPAIYVEVGGNALVSDTDAATVANGLRNTLRALGLLDGEPAPAAPRAICPAGEAVAPATGLWRPAVRLEQHVRAGDPLGALTDPLGEELARVTAPADGLILYYMTALAVHEGEPLVNLVTVLD